MVGRLLGGSIIVMTCSRWMHLLSFLTRPGRWPTRRESRSCPNMIPARTWSTGEVLCAENLGKSLYVLNRGILPCCFKKSPFFTWDELIDKTLAKFVKDAWTSPVIQVIELRWRNA